MKKMLILGGLNLSRFLAIGCAVAVACALAGDLSAQTYNARNDFSLSANPNGVWSYGTLSTASGGTFSLLNVALTGTDYAGQQLWYNGGTYPDSHAVQANASGQSVTFGTVTVPVDQLNLDGENVIATVRWTAPADGLYNVSGFFQRNDNQSNAGPVAVEVAIILNGNGRYFDQPAFTTYGSQKPFNLSAVSLTAGSTLDFAEIPTVPHNDSVGLSALITYAGPLPQIDVTATTPTVSANGGTPGVFTLTRTGATTQQLIVDYSVKGSGQPGVDYVLLKGTKKFKAGKSSVQIKVQPIAESNPAPKKVVKLTVGPGSGYAVGPSATAKVKIVSE